MKVLQGKTNDSLDNALRPECLVFLSEQKSMMIIEDIGFVLVLYPDCKPSDFMAVFLKQGDQFTGSMFFSTWFRILIMNVKNFHYVTLLIYIDAEIYKS